MDTGLRTEVRGVKADGYSLGEAIDRVAVSKDVQGLALKRTKKGFKRITPFDGFKTGYKMAALPL